MRKFILLFAAAALSSLGMTAQQLNGTFDGTWVNCYPNNGTTAVGTQPEGWNVSNVFQVKPFILVTPDKGRPGNEAGHSVKMVNTWCGVKLGIFINAGATAPAYMTLGNTWSYGDMDNQSIDGESDGGAYGGMDFAYRPDAVSLWVKRLHSTAESTSNKNSQINKEEKASVIFYSWKGSTTSSVKIGLGSQAAPIDPIEMEDREKDVLGKRTPDSKTEDFELISSMEQYIEGDIDKWTQMVYDIKYHSESTPKKVNLIVSSSDFFDRAKMGEGNQLWVDDVDFVYYSTLTGLEVGGAAVLNFAANKYAYDMGAVTALPTEESISAVAKSPRANVEVTVDEAAWQVRIVVTNQGGMDLDGETSHTYTLQYEKPETTEYAGYLNINMVGMPLTYNADATVRIVDYKDGTCDFILPDFTLNLGGEPLKLGDIAVPEATMTEDASGVKTFEGLVPEMSLMGGEIKARVELNGTIDAEGKANFDVDVTWFDVDSEIPIAVTFSSDMVGEELGGYYYIVENGDYENPVEEKTPVTLLSAQVTRTDKPALPPYTLVLKDVTFKNATADIVVEGIDMKEENPAVTYSGTATNVALPDGTVAETVAVKGGTTDGDHYEIKFTVTVDGSESVIGFTTEPVTSGVDGVAAGEVAVYGADGAIVVDGFDGEVAVYAADGQLVKSAAVDGHAEIAVAGGLYVVRAGEAVKKVIVK